MHRKSRVRVKLRYGKNWPVDYTNTNMTRVTHGYSGLCEKNRGSSQAMRGSRHSREIKGYFQANYKKTHAPHCSSKLFSPCETTLGVPNWYRPCLRTRCLVEEQHEHHRLCNFVQRIPYNMLNIQSSTLHQLSKPTTRVKVNRRFKIEIKFLEESEIQFVNMAH